MTATLTYQSGGVPVTSLTGTETIVVGQGGPQITTATAQQIANLANPLTDAIVVVAAAGATQGTATAIPTTAELVNVTTTTSSEGVKLPTASTGRSLTILPPTTIGLKVYGGAAGQLINAGTTATTAFSMVSGKPLSFYAVDKTHWRVSAPNSLAATTIAASGAISANAGLTVSQTLKEGWITVAAAGATAGTATAISATAVVVQVTVTTSAEGVKLPTCSTGRMITLYGGSTTKGFKVYGGAALQTINAATTNTTAYAMTTLHPATFIGTSGTNWRVLRGN